MTISIVRLSALVCFLVALTLCSSPDLLAQRSPHGSIKIACGDCHLTTSWKDLASPMKFNHDKTRFALKGQHSGLACGKCHKDLEFTGTSPQCVDCHMDVHRGELGAECQRCHTPATWLVPDMAQRHNRTRFPLLGAHMTTPCQACHVNQQKNEYIGLTTDCYGCHRTQYDATTAPPHRSSGFGTDCVECHPATAVTWGTAFNHSQTAFPLTGAHVAVTCSQCHQGGRFRGTPLQCVACHQADATRVTSPKHTPPSFSSECASCHSTAAWKPSTFDHSKTQFPLTGAHLAVACNQCHLSGQYQNTPAACSACHQTDYTNVVTPKHTQPSFSLDCTVCHTTSAWKPSTFNHSTTAFPLTGAHVTTPCASCHASGLYAGMAKTCVGCHQRDYNNTTNPNHAAAAFPTDCQTCHSTAAWSPSSWNHDPYFPISVGTNHSPGRWTTCADCHTVATNYKVFSCVTCHDHSQALMDPRHSAVSGYSFDSNACYKCHPRGGGG